MLYWLLRRATGGISDGSRRGFPDSYQYGEGLDYRTDPDSFGVLPAPVKKSGSVVTDLIKWFVSDGTYAFAYGSSGNLYSVSLTDYSFTLIRAVSSSHGNGLTIFNDYLYYTRDATLGRYGPLSGAPAFSDSFQTTGMETDTEWHPITVFQNFIAVGNGQYVETYDGATWTGATHALTLAKGYRARCLEVWGQYLAIGVQRGATTATYPNGRVYLWDGISTTYNDIVTLSGSVNAMVNDNGQLMMSVGNQSQLYVYNGGNKALKAKSQPRLGTSDVDTYPGAMGTWRNNMIYGLYGGTSETVPKGVFTYGQVTKDFPVSLSFDYPLSTGSKTGSTVSVGAVKALSSSKLLVGWKDGTTYGVDLIDTTVTPYQTTARLETLIFDNGRPFLRRRPHRVRVITNAPLGIDEFIKVYLRKEGETTWTLVGQTDTDSSNKSNFTFQCNNNLLSSNKNYDSKGSQHEMRIDWGGTGTSRPTISSITTLLDEDPDIEV